MPSSQWCTCAYDQMNFHGPQAFDGWQGTSCDLLCGINWVEQRPEPRREVLVIRTRTLANTHWQTREHTLWEYGTYWISRRGAWNYRYHFQWISVDGDWTWCLLLSVDGRGWHRCMIVFSAGSVVEESHSRKYLQEKCCQSALEIFWMLWSCISQHTRSMTVENTSMSLGSDNLVSMAWTIKTLSWLLHHTTLMAELNRN